MIFICVQCIQCIQCTCTLYTCIVCICTIFDHKCIVLPRNRYILYSIQCIKYDIHMCIVYIVYILSMYTYMYTTYMYSVHMYSVHIFDHMCIVLPRKRYLDKNTNLLRQWIIADEQISVAVSWDADKPSNMTHVATVCVQCIQWGGWGEGGECVSYVQWGECV